MPRCRAPEGDGASRVVLLESVMSVSDALLGVQVGFLDRDGFGEIPGPTPFAIVPRHVLLTQPPVLQLHGIETP